MDTQALEIEVHFTAQLTQQLGVSRDVVQLPAVATTADLIRCLSDKHGERFHRYALTPDGQLVPSIIVCVNQNQVARDQPIGLRRGDRVHLISAISGG